MVINSAKLRTASVIVLMLGLSAAQGPSGSGDSDTSRPVLEHGSRSQYKQAHRLRSTYSRVDRSASLADDSDVRQDARLDEGEQLRLTTQFREAVEWAEYHSGLHRSAGNDWLDLIERTLAGSGDWGSGSGTGRGLSGAYATSASRRDGSLAWMGAFQQPVGGSVMPVATAAAWPRTFGFMPYSSGSGAPRDTDAQGESRERHQDPFREDLRTASVRTDVPAPATALLLAIGLLAGLSRRNSGLRFR